VEHLNDDAELYALGLTERERDAEIEAHLAECATCRERVVAAEAAAASLAATLPPVPAAAPRRASWWPGLATAAAVLFAFTTAYEGNAARTAGAEMQRTDVALSAIASSHFGHTTLTSEQGVIAKAIYARDGAWCYVVASGAPRGAHVVLHRGAAAHDMGAMDPGAPSTLFVKNPGQGDEITVVAGDRVIAHGRPAY
jgi:anti-sigma factor RsiW